MARAAVKAKQAQRAKAQPAKSAVRRGRRKHSGGGNPNQQLFFSRLRRRAKIAYIILAVLFAVTFAFLGVGSGSSGLDQLFSGINIFGGGGGSSVSKALKEAEKHPTDPKSFRDLATAYEAKGDTANSINALQQYTNLKPKDATAWNELAGLELVQAQSFTTQYQNAYAAEQLAAPSAAFQPTGKLGTALGTDPIEQAAATTRERDHVGPRPEDRPRVQRGGVRLPADREAPAQQLERAVPARAGRADGRAERGRRHRVQGVPEAEPDLVERGADQGADQAALTGAGEAREEDEVGVTAGGGAG